MKDQTYIGHSNVRFDKQWSISAEVALNGGPTFNYLDSVLDISVKKADDFNDWHILEGYDCPNDDSPDSPLQADSLYDCIELCLGLKVSLTLVISKSP